jgi:hypothetical protein
MGDLAEERQRLINQMAQIINDIDQMFCDAAFWNNETRPRLYPNNAPVDPDPDGFMARVRAGYVKSLEREATLGNAPTISFPPITPSKYIALTDTSKLRKGLRANLENRSN